MTLPVSVDAPGDVDDRDARPGPDRRVLVAVAAAAAGFDLAVRSGVACLAGAAVVVVAAVGLAAGGRLHNPQARAAAAAAPVFGAFLAWRDSPWLVLPDIVAAGMLLLLAASFAEGGSMADMTVPAFVRRLVGALAHVIGAPGFVVEALPPRRSDGIAPAVARGALVAAPIVLLLGLLLSSADAVFASFFRVSLDLPSAGAHVALGVVGALGMATLLRSAARGGDGLGRGQVPLALVAMGGVIAAVASALFPPLVLLALLVGLVLALVWGAHLVLVSLGTVERTVALLAVVALYSTFALAQVVAASEGGERVLRTAGLTYAEYARSGFFQLLVVAALTLVVLFALDDGTPVVRSLSGAAVVLTLVIVAVALRRFHLYEQAFGLTMLRLACVVFAVWVGAVFLLFGARLLGVGGSRQWWAPAAAATGLVLLLGFNAVNPESIVVRRNAARERFDVAYAATLSADAVPELVARGQGGRVCPRPERRGWAGWNRAQERAAAACSSRAQP